MGSCLHAAAHAIERCAGPLSMNVVLILPPAVEAGSGWFLDLIPRSSRFAGFELATDVDIVTVAPENAAVKIRHAFNIDQVTGQQIVPQHYEWS